MLVFCVSSVSRSGVALLAPPAASDPGLLHGSDLALERLNFRMAIGERCTLDQQFGFKRAELFWTVEIGAVAEVRRAFLIATICASIDDRRPSSLVTS